MKQQNYKIGSWVTYEGKLCEVIAFESKDGIYLVESLELLGGKMWVSGDHLFATSEYELSSGGILNKKSNEANSSYCSCINPDIIQSQTFTETFDYCRKCKKEKR